ncbi:hypothetical protein RND71_041444 [Anisodus tanguticus]|uniref:Vacuolar iron transporter n=1 Tax=Anisodus tanguticus TaxID=243964 RepID=A0AAE1UR57_9SOLA|nr:hypothetical protein RND71_041444 [Anisodus tanguticus]
MAAQTKSKLPFLKTMVRKGRPLKRILTTLKEHTVASAIAFSLGGIVPILASAFIANHKVRLAVIVAAVSLTLVAFGGIGAFLGRSPMVKSCAIVLIGGWMAMAITFGLTKLIGSTGLEL